jgi:hypothetical protein
MNDQIKKEIPVYKLNYWKWDKNGKAHYKYTPLPAERNGELISESEKKIRIGRSLATQGFMEQNYHIEVTLEGAEPINEKQKKRFEEEVNKMMYKLFIYLSRFK